MVATAAARRNLLLVDGENYPGFLSYNGNDSELDFGGVIYHEGTIEISNVKENPRSVDCREYPTYWCYGKKIELWMADGNNVMKLHPRGRLYIVSSYYDYQSQLLTLKVGCKLTLRKVVTIDDFKTPEELFPDPEETPTPTPTPTPSPTPTPTPTPAPVGNKWWQQYERVGKEKPASAIVSELVSRAGCGSVTGSVSGNVRLPFSLSGSLISQAGELVFKTSGKYLWSNNNGGSIITDIDFDAAPNLICELGKQEVDFKPIDSGLPAIAELVVSATVKEEDKSLGSTEEVTPDGDKKTTKQTSEYGPNGIITLNMDDVTNVLFATITEEEIISPTQKRYTTTRNERKCLALPETRTNRGEFIDSYINYKTQNFTAGRLGEEVDIVVETVGKALAGMLAVMANFPVDVTINAGGVPAFMPAFVSGKRIQGIGHRFTMSAELVFSSKRITTYDYYPDGTLRTKTMTLFRPACSVIESYYPLIGDAIAAEQEIETWTRNGKNETYKKVYKKTYYEMHKDMIIEWEGSNRVYQAEKNADYLSLSNVPYPLPEGYTKQLKLTDGREITVYFLQYWNWISAASIPFPDGSFEWDGRSFDVRFQWRLTWEMLSNLMTYKEEVELSRSGQSAAPATEHLPVKDPEATNDEWPNKEYKDVPIYRVRKWLNSTCSEFKPPREYTQLGEIYNKDIISKLTKIAFRLRQGKTKSYELVLPLTYAGNYWLLDNYKPVQIVKVIWPNGKAAQFLASGVNFSVTQDSNLVLLDLLWLGNYNGNVVDDYISASAEYNLIKAYPLLISNTEAVLTEGGGYVQIGG